MREKRFKDEPQHLTQGLITEDFLKNLNIKYNIINNKSNFKKIIKKLCQKAKKKNEVVALLVRKNSFENEYDQKQNKSKLMLREQVLNVIVKRIPNNSIVISTTGILSRELNELIKK